MEFHSHLHPQYSSATDHPQEPNLKKSKLENGSGNGCLSTSDSEDFSILDQPQTIFRQVSNSTKLPKTAFVLYLNHYKDSFFAQHPQATFQDFQTQTLFVWKSLPSSEKNVWLHKEVESRKDFFQQVQRGMIDIAPSSTAIPPAPAAAGAGLSPSSDGEKKPQHSSKLAFPTFVQAMRDQVLLENPSFTYNEIQKELSKAWKNMSREEKQIWINAVLDTPLSSTSRKTSYPRRSSSVPTPPKSAYSLFYQCARKQLLLEFPDLSGKEIPGVCSELWKNLPAIERSLWQADAENDRLRYHRECALAAQNNSQIGKRNQMEKQPSLEPSLSPSDSAEGLPQQTRRKYQKSSSKKESKGDGPRLRKSAILAIDTRDRNQRMMSSSSSSSLLGLEESSRSGHDYFSYAPSDHLPFHELEEDDHQIGKIPSDEQFLKMPSHDSMFDDHQLTYDTLFCDSDPFQADLHLFPSISSSPPSSTTAASSSQRSLDSKHFLHEDLSLFGRDSISSFSL